MNTLVSVKATLLGEPLLTNLTLVRSLTSVSAHVHLQVRLATETGLTHLQTFYCRKLVKNVTNILCFTDYTKIKTTVDHHPLIYILLKDTLFNHNA